MTKCTNPRCKADPLHIFSLHPGDLCSECYDFEEDRNRDLTKLDYRVASKQAYIKKKESEANRSKNRARRLSKNRVLARAHIAKIKQEREVELR